MSPSAIDEPMPLAPPEKIYPPAKIYPVRETKFEGYVPPQEDGREKALQQSEAAIVIDNGCNTLLIPVFGQLPTKWKLTSQ